MHEKFQFAIIGKFSHGKPDITGLRKVIPMQCAIKGACNIVVLDARYILIQLEILEDYVNMLSASIYYIKIKDMHQQMRMLKQDPWFELDVEMTIGVAWILFPDLPTNFL